MLIEIMMKSEKEQGMRQAVLPPRLNVYSPIIEMLNFRLA
jgi:hypothetical protein